MTTTDQPRHAVDWTWRDRAPAKSPANPAHPHGVAMDLSGGAPSCEVALTYPAPGVGTWFINCRECGCTVAVTAAGRADDPTKVRVACKRPSW
jgi:hypothetical protein